MSTRTSFNLLTPPSQSQSPKTTHQSTPRRLSSATTVTTDAPTKKTTRTTTNTNSPTKKPIKTPWRVPGCWKMPDIIQENWKQQQQQEKPTPRRPEPPKKSNSNHTNKPRWVNVGKTPDHFPLPPLRRSQAPKPHAVFDAKLRKVLPRNKILNVNPKVHYTGTEQVGSGANGAVIRAVEGTRQNQTVAIKRCFIEDHDTHHHSYVLRELRIMGCLEHDNLIHLQAACLYEDHLWMAMELMSCSVFGLLYNTTVGLDEPTMILIAHECLQGLVYLHSKGYMHRDVKCENILLGAQGQVKLADFGLATPLSIQNTANLGTAKWMAPQVITGTPYTANVDVWSLGITMIEMMDRVPPLYYLENTDDIYHEILYGKQPTFQFSTPSSALHLFLEWMLDENGDRRPMAKDVLKSLKKFISQGFLKCAVKSDLAHLVQDVFE
ncbi:kinase-like domain-containing protein [Chlamydoabsidia padenii]|nr:kinase-like domain-containing protein [Chlamydoabsidia padenii]